ncbi:hypothetical protein A3B57_02740 [Microgenomates group bacterium RIFCSPLOWO2_01_FULL_47_10]|nr:MAG: hypothetical protein A3B57_02740 [Microgenomates group bacterium RIFCSPLOWO2_01_FULL_47_10]
MKNAIIVIGMWLLAVGSASANPYFYFDEGSNTVVNHTHSVGLFIVSDGTTLTAAQTIIDLPNTYVSYETLLVADYPAPSPDPAGTKPNCFHSPLPPEWGLGAGKTSPYYDEDTHKLYLSCGFTNPGYTTQGSTGDKIATLTFFADAVGTDTISLDSANTLFYYGASGSTLGPAAQSAYTISILEAVEPTPATGEIPEKATDSISEGDLNFVDIATIGTSGTTVAAPTLPAGSSDLTVVEEDNTIPPPPADLALRDRLESIINRIRNGNATSSAAGEVLSLQSLRELLIPGKSDADRQVVVFNLISLLLFLIILSLITWRLISQNRTNKAKTRHMSDLLVAELATIESKLGNAREPGSKAGRESIEETIKQISDEIKADK